MSSCVYRSRSPSVNPKPISSFHILSVETQLIQLLYRAVLSRDVALHPRDIYLIVQLLGFVECRFVRRMAGAKAIECYSSKLTLQPECPKSFGILCVIISRRTIACFDEPINPDLLLSLWISSLGHSAVQRVFH